MINHDGSNPDEHFSKQNKTTMNESTLRSIIREEIKQAVNEVGMQQRRVNQPKQLRKAVSGKKVQSATGNLAGDTYQYELDFPNGEKLLIQNPDTLLFNER